MTILLGLRKEHLNSILKSYHKELEDNLLGLGFELDTYPYAQLVEDYQVLLIFKAHLMHTKSCEFELLFNPIQTNTLNL